MELRAAQLRDLSASRLSTTRQRQLSGASHDPAVAADFLLEIARSGEVVWRWSSHEHLAADFERAKAWQNKTHINSVNELPANRWFDKGHDEFRPGNILISARSLNALYIVDRSLGTVVWQFYDDLDFQHEALMIPPGVNGAGNILVFNNGYHDKLEYRRSAILEFNPKTGKPAWEYRDRGFFSSTGGTQQILANGNILVTSSQGGRVFELTRDGRIVWQWSPPFKPMRALRYQEAYSPQLEQLGSPSNERIDRRNPEKFFDRDLYTFSLPHQRRRIKVGDGTKYVLKDRDRCQILRVPGGAELEFGYGGFTRQREPGTPFVDEGQVRFTITLGLPGQEGIESLFDQIMELSELDVAENENARVILHRRKLPLGTEGAESIELCLQISSSLAPQILERFVWEEPQISSGSSLQPMDPESMMDKEALEKQEKHLKAIGYIN